MAKKPKAVEQPVAITKEVAAKPKTGPREQLASLIAARSGRGYFVAFDASRVIPDGEIPDLLKACGEAKGEAVYVFDAAIAAKAQPEPKNEQ